MTTFETKTFVIQSEPEGGRYYIMGMPKIIYRYQTQHGTLKIWNAQFRIGARVTITHCYFEDGCWEITWQSEIREE